jgi:hypothetical protein
LHTCVRRACVMCVCARAHVCVIACMRVRACVLVRARIRCERRSVPCWIQSCLALPSPCHRRPSRNRPSKERRLPVPQSITIAFPCTKSASRIRAQRVSGACVMVASRSLRRSPVCTRSMPHSLADAAKWEKLAPARDDRRRSRSRERDRERDRASDRERERERDRRDRDRRSGRSDRSRSPERRRRSRSR